MFFVFAEEQSQRQEAASLTGGVMRKSAKQSEYLKLVRKRRICGECAGLLNPAQIEGGRYDSNHIGPWSRWQGNLDADLMVVGQDWGDDRYFSKNQGFDDPGTPTNKTLVKLLASVGKRIASPSEMGSKGKVFLTNGILCLKKGGLQARLRKEWFDQCGSRFLKPLIDIVKPKVLVALGEEAFRAILRSYDWPDRPSEIHRDDVERRDGIVLPGNMLLFAVYHCGAGVLNRNRDFEEQEEDWARIGIAFKSTGG